MEHSYAFLCNWHFNFSKNSQGSNPSSTLLDEIHIESSMSLFVLLGTRGFVIVQVHTVVLLQIQLLPPNQEFKL